MKAIWNGIKISDSRKVEEISSNRALLYGDGFFETIRLESGQPCLLPYHMERLVRTAAIFNVNLPECLTTANLNNWLTEMGQGAHMRARLVIWRKSGGLYTPSEKDTEFLITLSEHKPRKDILENVALATTIHLYPTPWSSCKTTNALPYVFASQEKEARQLGEIILTDTESHIAEAGAANIFWEDQERNWYTPALSTGCIGGVMRAFLLTQLQVKEVKSPATALLAARRAFICNVTGLYSLADFEGSKFSTTHLEDIRKLIQLPRL